VVNNNASAVLLVLTALAKRRKVLIARSQLVEIGGGFRIPDVMKQSGAKLFEIGTTNRVHLSDYENAIQEESIKLVMRAHRSNFQIIGFTSEPTLEEIVDVSHLAGIPVLDDLGSGSLIDTMEFGLGHEPMVQESLEAGVDLVCFSGDKLLGGPQAGIILGKLELINKLKKHPLARAIRADKLCLAALSATLVHYLKSEALTEIPIWLMIGASLAELQTRARRWIQFLGQGELIEGVSTVGGGSLPGETLPTWLVALSVRHPNKFLASLREAHPPIIARLEENRVVLDPRTVLANQEEQLLTNLQLKLGN
jgi:L-seryl-tRNA(Ser) seleniumtransferase